MAITTGGQGSTPSTMSEINVTPLVDVMLVLLTIFMIASSVETIQVKQEKERLLRHQKSAEEIEKLLRQLEMLRRAQRERDEQYNRKQRELQRLMLQEEKLKELQEQLLDRSQNVPVNLPKVNSEPINLAEQKKIVISFTKNLEFYIGDTKVVSCPEVAKRLTGSEKVTEKAYKECLKEIEKKLVANEKLKEDKECYLRADKQLDYGKVLALMATVRKAGVTKFGLIAEEEEEEKK